MGCPSSAAPQDVQRWLGLAPALAWRSAALAAEVNVHSSPRHYRSEPAMEAFTRKTGAKINGLGGSDREVFERLRAGRTQGDVLITGDPGILWGVARHGLLARVEPPGLHATVPPCLDDPEGRRYGLTVRARTTLARLGPVEAGRTAPPPKPWAIAVGRTESARGPPTTCTTGPIVSTTNRSL